MTNCRIALLFTGLALMSAVALAQNAVRVSKDGVKPPV
jgi:hypothetical protein